MFLGICIIDDLFIFFVVIVVFGEGVNILLFWFVRLEFFIWIVMFLGCFRIFWEDEVCSVEFVCGKMDEECLFFVGFFDKGNDGGGRNKIVFFFGGVVIM